MKWNISFLVISCLQWQIGIMMKLQAVIFQSVVGIPTFAGYAKIIEKIFGKTKIYMILQIPYLMLEKQKSPGVYTVRNAGFI